MEASEREILLDRARKKLKKFQQRKSTVASASAPSPASSTLVTISNESTSNPNDSSTVGHRRSRRAEPPHSDPNIETAKIAASQRTTELETATAYLIHRQVSATAIQSTKPHASNYASADSSIPLYVVPLPLNIESPFSPVEVCHNDTQNSIIPVLEAAVESPHAAIESKSAEMNIQTDVIRNTAHQRDPEGFDARDRVTSDKTDALKTVNVSLVTEYGITSTLPTVSMPLEETVGTQTLDTTSSPLVPIEPRQRTFQDKDLSIPELTQQNAELDKSNHANKESAETSSLPKTKLHSMDHTLLKANSKFALSQQLNDVNQSLSEKSSTSAMSLPPNDAVPTESFHHNAQQLQEVLQKAEILGLENSQLVSDKNSLTLQLEFLRRQLQSMKSCHEQIEPTSQDVNYEHQKTQLQDLPNIQTKSSCGDCENLHGQIHSLKSELSTYEQESRELESSLRTEIAQLKRALEESQQNASNEIASLQDHVSHLQDANKKVSRDLSAAQTVIAQEQTVQKRRSEDVLRKMVSEKEADVARNVELTHRVRELEECKRDLESEISRGMNMSSQQETQARSLELMDQLKELQGVNKLLAKELDAARQQLDEKDGHAARIIELEELSKRLKKELEKRTNIAPVFYDGPAPPISPSLEASIQTLELEFAQAQSRIEKLVHQNQGLELSLLEAREAHTKEINSSNRSREDCQTRLLQLEGELKAWEFQKEAAISQLTCELEKITHERDALGLQISELQGMLSSKAVEPSEPVLSQASQPPVSPNTLAIEVLQTENKELKDVVASLSDDLDEANTRHFDLSNKLKQQAQEFASKYESLYGSATTVPKAQYEKAVGQYSYKIESLQHALETTKDRFHDAQARSQSLLDNLMRTEAELARLRLSQADIGAALLQNGPATTQNDLIRSLQSRNDQLATEVMSLRNNLTETKEHLENLKMRALERESLVSSAAESLRELSDLRSQIARERETWNLKERSLYAATESIQHQYQFLLSDMNAIKKAIWETADRRNDGWSRGLSTERVEDVNVLSWVRWMCDATQSLERTLEETHQVLDAQHEKMESVIAMSSVAGGSIDLPRNGAGVGRWEVGGPGGSGRQSHLKKSHSRLDEVSSSSSSSAVSALIQWSKTVGEASSNNETFQNNESYSSTLLLTQSVTDDKHSGMDKMQSAMKKLLSRNVSLQQRLDAVEAQLQHQLATNAEIKKMFVENTVVGSIDMSQNVMLEQYNDALLEIGALRADVEHWRARHDEMEIIVENAVMEKIAGQARKQENAVDTAADTKKN
ncbi:hypothetical protein BJ741DRAFT_607867 [Chytriomyces cf. hyalinus JEL632]|nr:hypothetical protein BJ741DRAFT_607867 [Chytriomyces cf. hyalinus JEL632]